MKIGIFDSGIGGLTVLSYLKKLLPAEEYYYYADSDHVPYGTKTNEEILEYSKNAVTFLVDKGCDMVCIACNTATSVAAEELRKMFSIPIIGIEPAVKPAIFCDHNDDSRILVIATPVTVKEKKLHQLIERYDENKVVDLKALPQLPSFAEKGMFDGSEVETYLNKELAELDISAYSRVVLGCTHFIHFIDLFRNIFNEGTMFLDGCEGTARHICKKAAEVKLESKKQYSIMYFKSGRLVECKEELAFYDMLLDRLEAIRLRQYGV